MATAPYGVRLIVGAATIALEETRKLPQTILMYPMTLISQAAHAVMRFQQNIAELAVKGDATLETLFPPKDEQPAWATFDEDDEDLDGSNEPRRDVDAVDTDRLTAGRFALYSVAEGSATTTVKSAKSSAPGESVPTPEVVNELEYKSLTLAQLRARLPALSVGNLETLLAYEESTTARAPFQTLLANRIIRATAK